MRALLVIATVLLLPVSHAAARGVVPVYLLEKLPDGTERGVNGGTVTVLGEYKLVGHTDDTGLLCGEYSGARDSVQVTIERSGFKPIHNVQLYVAPGCDPIILQRAKVFYLERSGSVVKPTVAPVAPEYAERQQKSRVTRSYTAVVRDRRGNSLPDVEVNTFNACLGGASTKSNGYFRLQTNECELPSELSIELKKPGYNTKTKAIVLSSQARDAESIVLDTVDWGPAPREEQSGAYTGSVTRSTGQPGMAVGMGIAGLLSAGASVAFWRLREGKAEEFNTRSDCDPNLPNRGATGCRTIYDSGETLQSWMILTGVAAGGFALATAYFLWLAPRTDLGTYTASCSPGAIATTLTCRVSF